MGSDSKRTFLTSHFGIPASHIFNSRDASFVQAIKTATHGDGVDVVMCSLSGDLLHESFNCLAACGRLVEVGRSDIYEHGNMDLAGLKRNGGFFSFDLSLILEQAPKVISRYVLGQ